MALISAHRGGSALDGERAVERYLRAIELGVDYVEFDVRRTLDRVMVVCHDDCTVSGRSIAAFDYAELTGELGGEALTLDALLDAAAGRVGLHLDLKEAGFEELLVNTVLERCPVDSLVITSHDAVVFEVKRLFPQVRAGLSLGEDLTHVSPWLKPGVRLRELFPGRRLKECRADFVAVHRQLAALNVLRYCQDAGMPAWVWTVDEEREIARFMADSRVTTLITDRPEVALRLRSV